MYFILKWTSICFWDVVVAIGTVCEACVKAFMKTAANCSSSGLFDTLSFKIIDMTALKQTADFLYNHLNSQDIDRLIFDNEKQNK